jgi:hypothetical protein
MAAARAGLGEGEVTGALEGGNRSRKEFTVVRQGTSPAAREGEQASPPWLVFFSLTLHSAPFFPWCMLQA